MTALVISQILCDCPCCKGSHRCHVTFPEEPVEISEGKLRQKAYRQGWRRLHDLDWCPPCAAIKDMKAPERAER